MEMALIESHLNADDVNYVNAHGTSTQVGDIIELNAVEKLFQPNKNMFMSSNKSAIGHLLGAAGAVEAVFSFKTLETKILPPTLNLDNPDTKTSINLIPHDAISKTVKNVISNSFGLVEQMKFDLWKLKVIIFVLYFHLHQEQVRLQYLKKY